jgi:hypothetical protein
MGTGDRSVKVTQQEADWIRKGLKTEHRILAQDTVVEFQRRRRPGGRRAPLTVVPSESPAQRIPQQPKPDTVISIRCPGDGAVAVRITNVRREPLSSVDKRAARAEGHKDIDAFKTWWIARHDRDWAQREPDRVAWLHAPYGRPRADQHIQRLEDVIAGPLARFDARWAHRDVYVMTLKAEPVEDFRALADFGHGDDRGYATSPAQAIPDEHQAVSDRWLDRFAKGARVGEDEALRRELAEATQALSRAREHARRLGMDIDGEVHGIETRRDKIIAKLERQRPAA